MELMAAVRQSRQMLQEGACEGAVRILSAAIEEASTHEEECLLLHERASTHIQAGDARKGLPDADRIIALFPQSETGYMTKANILNILRRYNEAESVLTIGQLNASTNLTKSYRKDLEAAKAQKVLKAVEMEIESTPGMLGNAIWRLTDCIGQDVAHQHSHTVRLRRSKLLLACHKHEDAIHDCKQCLLEKPRHPEAYLILAEAYAATGQHNEAKAAYYKSDAAGPSSSECTLKREEGEIGSLQQEGNACFQEERYTEAITHYTAAINLHKKYQSQSQARPQSGARMLDLGLALSATGSFQEAAQHLRNAVYTLGQAFPEGNIDLVLALQDLANCLRMSMVEDAAQKGYPLMQRAAEMARRVGGESSILYALTLNNLIIVLPNMGTRSADLKDMKKRAGKLMRGLRVSRPSLFIAGVDLWISPSDLFRLNRWPHRVRGREGGREGGVGEGGRERYSGIRKD